MYINNWKKDIFTIPNVLSVIRLMLIPLYIIIYLNARNMLDYYVSAGILAVSCITDLIDGIIARQYNMISTLGKMLDPVADKVTQFTLILCLAIRKKHVLLWAFIALFVAKEGFQLIAGSMILRKGKILSGALISVYYNRVIPKSSRLKGFFSKGSEHSNNYVRGVRFSDVNDKKHIITY